MTCTICHRTRDELLDQISQCDATEDFLTQCEDQVSSVDEPTGGPVSDEPITTAELNSAIPDLHFWRYDTPTGMCDHPITLTNRATLWAGSWQATTTEVVTVCLDCDQIFQQEDR